MLEVEFIINKLMDKIQFFYVRVYFIYLIYLIKLIVTF